MTFLQTADKWLLVVTTAAFLPVAVACEGSGGDETPTASAVDDDTAVATQTEPTSTATAEPPTATATATSQPTETVAAPTVPPLPSGATEIASGTLELRLPPAGQEEIEPVELAVAEAGEAPPCAGFVANWAWTTDPPNEDLVVTGVRQGGGSVLGEGASGSANGGCILMRFSNNSEEQVLVTVDYVLGDISGP